MASAPLPPFGFGAVFGASFAPEACVAGLVAFVRPALAALGAAVGEESSSPVSIVCTGAKMVPALAAGAAVIAVDAASSEGGGTE